MERKNLDLALLLLFFFKEIKHKKKYSKVKCLVDLQPLLKIKLGYILLLTFNIKHEW